MSIETYETQMREVHNVRALIELLAFKALYLGEREDSEAAMVALTEAVELALPGRMFRPFIDLGPPLSKLLSRLKLNEEILQFNSEIIAALRAPEQIERSIGEPARQTELDPLSRRELEILSLLAERLSNREIADQLFISIATVKRHTANIYQKLAVVGRREAVLKASNMGILRSQN
jgi:LuxR family maltose regulon positive regulatory protein